MVVNNAQLHLATTFSNKVFRKDKEFARYVRRFRDRAMYPSFTIQPSAFSKFDMDISQLIHNLGWGSLFEHQRYTYCLEAVCLFYVNLKRGSGPDLYSFKTTIGNLEITLGVDLRDKVTLCNVHDDLKAQHVLARLDASVSPAKPVPGSGGEAATLVKALVSAAEVVIDRELNGLSNENLKGKRKMYLSDLSSMSTRLKHIRDGGGVSFSRAMEEDEAVEEPVEDNVSDYDSPPDYPF
ncbi:unnamed protein product [Linum trigynum]|uniref:Uncharacterized protein n=1 Tax=Linum trigynum TaxID=586398 RepID=A0AAV2E491_9ROSI